MNVDQGEATVAHEALGIGVVALAVQFHMDLAQNNSLVVSTEG